MQTREERNEYKRRYNKERAEFLRANGLCAWCGKSKAMDGLRLCYNCWCKSAENHAAAYRRLTPEQKKERNAQLKEYRRQQRQSWRAAGLCSKCGQRKPAPGRKQCTDCLIKSRRNAQKRRIENGTIPRFLRGKGEYCYFCGERVEVEGDKVCKKCHERLIEQAAHARENIKRPPSWEADNLRVFQRGGKNDA